MGCVNSFNRLTTFFLCSWPLAEVGLAEDHGHALMSEEFLNNPSFLTGPRICLMPWSGHCGIKNQPY